MNKIQPKNKLGEIRKAFEKLVGREDWDKDKVRTQLMYFDSIRAKKLKEKNPVDLANCNAQSVIDCVLEVAGMDLTLNPQKKEAYLVPFWNKNAGEYICTLMISYQGEINYLYQNGVIEAAEVASVRENDTFTGISKTGKGIEYRYQKPRSGPRGELQGAYCIYLLKSGNRVGDYFTFEEIEKRRKVSKQRDGNFWRNWTDEMYIKTAVRMARRGLPRTAAIAKLDAIDNTRFDLSGGFIDAERILEVEAMFEKANTKKRLKSAYALLNKIERTDDRILELYDQRAATIQDLA